MKPSKENVINLSHTLGDAVYSLLQKGLNYAVTPCITPIEGVLAGVEKTIQFLPEEKAEEARQETVRIIKSSSKLGDKLTKAEREALRSLEKNTNLTILLADKSNATVILNTVDYKQKIASLLEDPSYKSLARDATDTTEHKTALLLKKSTLTEDICKQLRLTGSRPLRLYGLPKIHKEGVHLKSIVSNIGATTYKLSSYLSGLPQQLISKFAHHVT